MKETKELSSATRIWTVWIVWGIFFLSPAVRGWIECYFCKLFLDPAKKKKNILLKPSILFPVRQATAMYPYINEKDSNCADYKQSLDVKWSNTSSMTKPKYHKIEILKSTEKKTYSSWYFGFFTFPTHTSSKVSVSTMCQDKCTATCKGSAAPSPMNLKSLKMHFRNIGPLCPRYYCEQIHFLYKRPLITSFNNRSQQVCAQWLPFILLSMDKWCSWSHIKIKKILNNIYMKVHLRISIQINRQCCN